MILLIQNRRLRPELKRKQLELLPLDILENHSQRGAEQQQPKLERTAGVR
jgi:hypothetical protein